MSNHPLSKLSYIVRLDEYDYAAAAFEDLDEAVKYAELWRVDVAPPYAVVLTDLDGTVQRTYGDESRPLSED